MKTLFATIGHTVVRMPDGTWIPSGIYQEIEWPDGRNGKIDRTFVSNPDLDPDSPNAYLGGGEMAVRALCALWSSYVTADVACIGGRPASMDARFGSEVASITEAGVMAHYFLDLARISTGLRPEVCIVGQTKNTEDDIRALLTFVRDGGYEKVIVVAMGFRLPRCRLLMRDFTKKNPEFRAIADLHVTFVDAEQFLPTRLDKFVVMNQSKAYATTMAQEKFGIRNLLNENPQ